MKFTFFFGMIAPCTVCIVVSMGIVLIFAGAVWLIRMPFEVSLKVTVVSSPFALNINVVYSEPEAWNVNLCSIALVPLIFGVASGHW